jgi:hypothetical protein
MRAGWETAQPRGGSRLNAAEGKAVLLIAAKWKPGRRGAISQDKFTQNGFGKGARTGESL